MTGRMKLSNAIRPPAGLTEKFCLSHSALQSRPFALASLPYSRDHRLASAKLLAGGGMPQIRPAEVTDRKILP